MGILAPVLVVDRFPRLRAQLLDLFGQLSTADWARPTTAGSWSVKDVAVHLLGGDIGILSRRRDRFDSGKAAVSDYASLVNLVNRLNDEWVRAGRRMSPQVLRDLLASTGPQVEAYFASLDPFAVGVPVNWAGPDPAPVWLDLAREFSERWHHQQQIRDAVGQPPLYAPYFLAPVLDAFMRALPHAYRDVEAPLETTLQFEISGDAGGGWHLIRRHESWELAPGLTQDQAPAAEVSLTQDTAWRMFTKGIDSGKAQEQAVCRGDLRLASGLFKTIAVIG